MSHCGFRRIHPFGFNVDACAAFMLRLVPVPLWLNLYLVGCVRPSITKYTFTMIVFRCVAGSKTGAKPAASGAGSDERGSSALPHRPSTYLCCAQRLVCRCLCRLGRDRRWLEAFDDQPDAQPQLPDELRADHDAPHHRAWLEDPE